MRSRDQLSKQQTQYREYRHARPPTGHKSPEERFHYNTMRAMLACLPSAGNAVQQRSFLFGAFRGPKKSAPSSRDAYGMRRGPMLALGFRLRRHPQVRPQCLVAFWKLLLDDLGVL